MEMEISICWQTIIPLRRHRFGEIYMARPGTAGAAAGNLLSGGEGAHYRAAFATKNGVAPESSDYRGNNDKYSASWGKSGADNRALGTENLLYSRSRGKSD